MQGLNRLISANHLRSLFTAAAAPYPKRLLRLNPPIRPFAFPQSSSRCVVDPPSPARIDDFVRIGENESAVATGTGDFVKIGESESFAAAGIDDFVKIGKNESAAAVGPDDFVEIGENESPASDSRDTYERKVLPPELLSDNVAMLTCESSAAGGICHVYLVGTCHVSTESSQEVEAIVKFLKPEVVFLELCSSRRAALKTNTLNDPTLGQVVNLLRKKQNPLGILYSCYLAKVARELGVVPGAEFRAAYEEANKYGGKVILDDRAVQITLRRVTAKMSLWDLTKFIYDGLFNGVSLPEDLAKKLKGIDNADMPKLLKRMNNVDVLILIEEMSKRFPYVTGPIVHERDQYMSAKLVEVARKNQSVVAVVGKGHLPGIQRNWEQPVDLEQLLEVPARKNTFTMGIGYSVLLQGLPLFLAFISPSRNSYKRKKFIMGDVIRL